MRDQGVRNRIRARVARWYANLEQLRAERKDVTGEARREYVERLQKLQTTIADEVREWNASIDDYDADPTQTTQGEFEEQVGLREIERQINADLHVLEDSLESKPTRAGEFLKAPRMSKPNQRRVAHG